MKAIWKCPIKMHYDKITAPVEKFLTAQMQRDTLCVWAIVDTEKEDRTFAISVMGTGWCLGQPEKIGDYIGTVQDGIYVWHLFASPMTIFSKGKGVYETDRTGN